MEATVKHVVVGDLVLLCMSDGTPRDVDLDKILELHRSNQVTRGIMLCVGNPVMTTLQRKRTAEAMGDHKGVVVTESAITRGVVTAMSWLGNPMTAARPRELREAIERLGAPSGVSVDEVLQLAEKLQRDVRAVTTAKAS